MELLILLVQRRGELVSREEIAEHLWGNDVFLDVDHSINTAVRKVRQVLKDDPERASIRRDGSGEGIPLRCAGSLQERRIELAGRRYPQRRFGWQRRCCGSVYGVAAPLGVQVDGDWPVARSSTACSSL